jgi:hypothetical protein
MALINPSSLYTAGAVKFDSTPSVNFYAQLMAKQQAKRDALDQYYSKLMNDTAGRENQMRPNDIEQGWQQKFNDWQSFYMNPQNRKAILNPSRYGYDKINKFNLMHQDLLADARKSTQELAQEKLINQHRLSGKWFPTDEDINEAHNISKSIYDPSRKIVDTDPSTGMEVQRDPNVSYLSLNIPDVTPAEKTQMMKGATGKIEPTTVAGEPDKARGLITMTSSYRPEDIKNIASNYANSVAQNRKFTNSYDRLMHDETTYHKYNEAFKKYFPEAGDIQTPTQMAAAEAVMNAEGAISSKVQKWTDPQEWYKRESVRQRNRLQLAAIGDAYAKGRQEFGHALTNADKQTANLWIDDYIDGLSEKALNTPAVSYKTAKGDVTQEHIIPLDATLAKSLAKDGIQPDQLRVTSDGNFRPVWFERDKNGVVQKTGDVAAVDNIRSAPISKDQVKLALGKTGAGVKQTNIEMSAPKSYKYNGKTYTQDQIEKGAKHYGISVQEYLKQLGIK